jgi:hypothetical protein
MQVGGAWANDVVRFELPSVAGHGVLPVMLAPLATGCKVTPPPAAVVVGFEPLAGALDEPHPASSTSVTAARTASAPRLMAAEWVALVDRV